MIAKCESFDVNSFDVNHIDQTGRKEILQLLTKLGPDRVIAVTTTRFYQDHERVTVWYWKDE